MGYTHYWTPTRSFTDAEWQQARDDFAVLFRIAQDYQGNYIALANGMGEYGSQPVIAESYISFNGVDLGVHGDQSHETFEITRTKSDWAFCKTASKPYDAVVTAALIYLAALGTHKPTSDGERDDWSAGLRLAYRAWPKMRERLLIPIGNDPEPQVLSTLSTETGEK